MLEFQHSSSNGLEMAILRSFEVSKTLNPKYKILLKFDFHYPTPYDGTLQTFALLKIKKIHDVCKDFDKTQKMCSF
jgi:hypothetical protein